MIWLCRLSKSRLFRLIFWKKQKLLPEQKVYRFLIYQPSNLCVKLLYSGFQQYHFIFASKNILMFRKQLIAIYEEKSFCAVSVRLPSCSDKDASSKSSTPEVFSGKGVLKICSKFTGEHACWSVISIKVQSKLYWNYTSTWLFSYKFAAYFQNTFS